jgi:hypothetical protein
MKEEQNMSGIKFFAILTVLAGALLVTSLASAMDDNQSNRPVPGYSSGLSRSGHLDTSSGSPYDSGSYDEPGSTGSTAVE